MLKALRAGNIQIPNYNIQITNKFQVPNSKLQIKLKLKTQKSKLEARTKNIEQREKNLVLCIMNYVLWG